MHRTLLIVCTMLVATSSVFGQTYRIPKTSSATMTKLSLSQKDVNAIPKSAFDSLTRQSFSRMVSGSTTAPNFQNYVSLNPAEGKFKLNGFFPIKRHGFSFAVNSGLINDNAAVLFDGGKVNNNTDLTVKFHLRIDTPAVQVDMRDMIPLIDQRKQLESEKKQKKDELIRALNGMRFKIADLETKRAAFIISGTKLRTDSIAEKKALDQCLAIDDKACVQAQGAKLAKLIADKKKWLSDTIKLRERIDSATMVATLDGLAFKPPGQFTNNEIDLFTIYGLGHKSYRDRALKDIDSVYDEKIERMFIVKLPMKEIDIGYITFQGSVGRATYKTYDPTAAFDDQIQKGDFTGYSYGVEFNALHSSNLFKNYYFFNFGVLRKKTNNLSDLSTSKVVNETNNTSGAVTRTTTKEYNAYTDPIKEFFLWNVYANYYLLVTDDFGSGLHLFLDTQFRDTDEVICNLGAGYIFGLTNIKDKRLINIELYVRANDMFGELNDQSLSLVKRSTIGITFGLPIYIPKN